MIRLRDTTDPQLAKRPQLPNPIGSNTLPLFSPIDISQYERYVKNPLITGDLAKDLDALTQTRAANQPWSHRAGNSIVKFIGKTGVNAAGSLLSLPAAVQAVTDGSLASFMDNELFKKTDEWTEWFDKTFPHYLTRAQEDYSIWQKMTNGDSGFWGDSFLGGASFLAGAALSEVFLSGGLGLLKSGSAVTKQLLQLGSKAEKAARRADYVFDAVQSANTAALRGRVGRMGLSMITSTGYEAGLEARHFKENAVTQLKEQFLKSNFREPNEKEIAEMQAYVDSAANSVFALNAVTVGISNAIMLDNLMGRPIGQAIDAYKVKKAAKRIKIEDGVASVIPKTKFRSVIDGTFTALGKPIVEGLEEGLQKSYEEGALESVLNKFNLEAFDELGIMTNIMNEGLAKSFGTKEGLEEVVVGALLGAFGLPGLGIRGSAADVISQIQGKDGYSTYLNRLAAEFTNSKDTALHNAVASAAAMFTINQERNIAMSLQDFFALKNAEAKSFFEYFNSRDNLGLLDSSINKFIDDIDKMSEEEFKNNYDKNITDVAEAKKEIKAKLKESVDRFRRAKNLAKGFVNEDIMSDDSNDFIKGAGSDLFRVFDLDAREEAIAKEIKTYVPDFDVNKANTVNRLNGSIGGRTTVLNRIRRQYNALKEERGLLAQELSQLIDEVNQNPESADARQAVNVVKEKIRENNKKLKAVAEERQKEYEDAINKTEQLRDDLDNKSFSLSEYERNFEELAEKIDDALTQQEKIEEVFSKSRESFDKKRLLREVSDLGRIASLRQVILDRFDNLTSPKGQQEYKISLDIAREKLIQHYQREIAFQAYVADIVNSIPMNDSYAEKLEKVKQRLEENINAVKEYKATAEIAYVYKYEGYELVLVRYKSGQYSLYKKTDKLELLVDDFNLDIVRDDERFSSLDTGSARFSQYTVGAITAEQLRQQIEIANNQFDLGITIDDNITIGETVIPFTDENVNLIKATVISAIESSPKRKDNKKEIADRSVELYQQENRISDKLVESYVSEDVVTEYDKKIEKFKVDALELAKSFIFSTQQRLDSDIPVAEAGMEFKPYQMEVYRMLGRSLNEQAEQTQETEEEEDKPEGGIKEVIKKGAKKVRKFIQGEPGDKAPTEIKGKGGVKKPGPKPKKGDYVTREVKSAVKQFIEVYTGTFGLKTEEQQQLAAKEVKRALAAGELNIGFEVESGQANEIDTVTKNVKRTKGTVVNGKTYHLYITLNGVRVGKILGGNRYIKNDGTPLDFNNNDDVKLYNPDLLQPENKAYLLELKKAQAALNKLNELIVSRAVSGTVSGQEILVEAGFAEITMDNINEFVLVQDADTNELRELIAENKQAFSIDSNFPVDEYGFAVGNVTLIPFYHKGQLTKYLVKDKDGNLSWQSSRLTLVEKSLNESHSSRANRGNETSSYILIRDSKGVVRSVDTVMPKFSDEYLEERSKTVNSVLDGSVGGDTALLTDDWQSTQKGLTVSFVSPVQGNETEFELEGTDKYNGDYTSSKDFVNMTSETRENKDGTKVLLFTLKRQIQLKSEGSFKSINLDSKPVTYRVRYDKKGLVVTTPKGEEVRTMQSFNIKDLLSTINQDIEANQESIFETLGQFDKVDGKNSPQLVVKSKDITPVSLKNVSIRDSSNDPSNYGVKMISTENAYAVNNASDTKPVPNLTHIDLKLGTPPKRKFAAGTPSEESVTSKTPKQPKPQPSQPPTSQAAVTDPFAVNNEMFSKPFSIVNQSNDVLGELGINIEALKKDGTITYTDETGTECAKAGMVSAKFTPGSKWTMIDDLKNMPTHEQGGVDLIFKDGGFMVGKVKAEKGLIIKFNK